MYIHYSYLLAISVAIAGLTSYLIRIYSHSSVGADVCDTYESQPMQNFTNFTCAPNDTSGGTPLGFQCISMTYPELTMDINRYPCYTVYNVTGRHIEVLVSELDVQMQSS